MFCLVPASMQPAYDARISRLLVLPEQPGVWRNIPFTNTLIVHLKPFQQECFIIGDREPISRMPYCRRMEQIEATIDLHGSSAHIFRRSYLNYAAGLGTDLKPLRSIAGHANIQTTMNRYVHKQNDKIIETGNRLQKLFSDGFVQTSVHKRKALKRLWHKHLKALQNSILCSLCAEKHYFKRMSVTFPHPAF